MSAAVNVEKIQFDWAEPTQLVGTRLTDKLD
jgi:hypothetical protein